MTHSGDLSDRSFSDEAYISVDIETAGPIPGKYSMLSLGACLVDATEVNFYIEFKPINEHFIPAALKVSKLTLEHLTATGRDPLEAMRAFHHWVREETSSRKPIFVGFNASFDWSFVNWYFHMFLGDNPFGIGAIDIKSYYMGISGCLWKETTSSQIPERFQPTQPQTHNALDDAFAQAEIFKKLMEAALQHRK